MIGVGKDTMNNLPFMHISLAEVIMAKSRERKMANWVVSSDQLEIHQSVC